MTIPERRNAPRISAKLPVSLVQGKDVFAAQTRNLSASGVYCTLRRFVEPMTKLSMSLELPHRPKPLRLRCQGVVVRVEPPRATPRRSTYQIAIFFNDLVERDRSLIARYVQQLQGATLRRW